MPNRHPPHSKRPRIIPQSPPSMMPKSPPRRTSEYSQRNDKIDAWSPKCDTDCDDRYHESPRSSRPNLLFGGFKDGHRYRIKNGYFTESEEDNELGTRVLVDYGTSQGMHGSSVSGQPEPRALYFSELMKDQRPTSASRSGHQTVSSLNQRGASSFTHSNASTVQPRGRGKGKQEVKNHESEEEKRKKKEGTVKGKAKWTPVNIHY
ncbi:hypothetical protein DM02DRAFT_629497 [Periconia macrospinosa]|uniref:Uncharacterized protein n=1 Tax=Periconia macrospinosa TaxID=97972 RepID=A0A2V1DN40_9PLEO|nr:hypothetical protein DM02DRAFT_629497 [Periconia macrospinosa]